MSFPAQLVAKRQTLNNLVAEFVQILNALEEVCEEGEYKEEANKFLMAMLEEVEKKLPSKIDGYVAVIRELQDFSEKCRIESHRLQVRADVWGNKANELKGRIQAAMTTLGLTRLKTPYNSVSVCKNGGVRSLVLPEDISVIPKAFIVERVIKEPDVKTIRAILENADPKLSEAIETVSKFASLKERGSHLRINKS